MLMRYDDTKTLAVVIVAIMVVDDLISHRGAVLIMEVDRHRNYTSALLYIIFWQQSSSVIYQQQLEQHNIGIQCCYFTRPAVHMMHHTTS